MEKIEEAIWRVPRREYEKTMKRKIKKKVGSMTIVVIEDTYDKALTAFNIGVGGIQMGMKVNMFFTSRGVNILKKAYKPRRARWGEAPIGWKEAYIRKRGGPILANLMYQAKDMGVNLYICYTSMISMGIKEEMFISGIKVLRMAEFLEISMESDAHFVIG
ncbi:MAG: DsrE/DsrF/DrsH-like family protein [Thermoplasmatales archaeon]|nr:MAG: DsrE/DsrF/DrsH-like family protein [Thermoplasmatales archaeon]